MQDGLFEFKDQTNTDHLTHGAVALVGSYQVRNFHGYYQSRHGASGKWLFYVSGFGRIVDGEHIECSLLLINGGYETVPIDTQDRITVRGRKYGRDHWQH